MAAKLVQRFRPCNILESIRARLQTMFVWEDRWVLRSLPLAAVAAITGQALMGGGIASCCISNNEQWQALRRHNRSQGTLETLKTGLGEHALSAVWCQCWRTHSLVGCLMRGKLSHSFIDTVLLSHSSSRPLWLACTTVTQEYWALTGCFIGNEDLFFYATTVSETYNS